MVRQISRIRRRSNRDETEAVAMEALAVLLVATSGMAYQFRYQQSHEVPDHVSGAGL